MATPSMPSIRSAISVVTLMSFSLDSVFNHYVCCDTNMILHPKVEMAGLDSVGGPLYIGTGCFHRRGVLCGRRFTQDYKEDWDIGTREKPQECIDQTEEKAKCLATCTYEQNTQWGNEIGVKYGCPVEDVITGLAIHCRGWESIYINPTRAAFIGVGPATLSQTILQHKRWSEGNFSIILSEYCPFFLGHGKMRLQHQMGYSIYGLWAPNSLPTMYYVTIPSLGLLKGTLLFPEVSYIINLILFRMICIENLRLM
jgi:hypothetical protein